MIVHFSKDQGREKVDKIAGEIDAFVLEEENDFVLVTSSSKKELSPEFKEIATEVHIFENDMQLSSKNYRSKSREVTIGNVSIGGDSGNCILIAGPCSVESEKQIEQSAALLSEMSLTCLRGGCYKPRTSPYSFQGMGLEGLKLLRKMKEKYGHAIVTEVRDATQVADVIEYADVIQIGAKSMYDHGILKACSKTEKPVLIKRGFGTTLQEFVQCAEFVLSGGNPNVILCERGLRTFETKTRFTLDLCGVAYLKEYTNLPIILDPSHAMGYAYGVPDLTRACLAMGIDGLLIEVHPDPSVAKSDASQQLNHQEFKELRDSLDPIATAVGYTIV